MDQDLKKNLDELGETVVNTSQRLEKAIKSQTNILSFWFFLFVVLLGLIAWELFPMRQGAASFFETLNQQSTSTFDTFLKSITK
jgi:hypothetical protein